MKKFITTITLQVEGAKKFYYKDALGNGGERVLTSFPIIQQISDVVTPGEHIKVITLLTGNLQSKTNLEVFKDELEALKIKKGFTYELIIVEKQENEEIETIIKLFSDIISVVEDGDRLYACITYGTKPIPIVTTMALRYAYKIKTDVEVEALIYGLIYRSPDKEPEAVIYDTTALFYIDSMVDRIAAMGVNDPEAALKALLGTEGL